LIGRPLNTQRIHWIENGEERSARWRSESGWPAPKKVVLADDTMNADTAYRLALEGTALLWRGDFQNARQLLQALVRRIEHKGGRSKRAKAAAKAGRRSPNSSTATAWPSCSAPARWRCS
jgi:hypothetical protein